MSYQPPPDLPTEFGLALACCRWSYARDSGDAVSGLAAEVDWAGFVWNCRRHRVQGLVWDALSALRTDVPAAARIVLSGEARSIAERGLRAAAEADRLRAAFDAAGVPLLFLKGLPLAMLAYGKPFTKMSADVDVLVMPEDLPQSAALLRELGYRLRAPGSESQLRRWHGLWKESVWTSTGNIVLELHDRVADQPQLLPALTASSRRQLVAITPGIALPTFPDEELFAYLCVHGASSAWFRLKWITDLAAVLHGRAAAEIDTLYERSQQLGAARAADQALLLAERLYGLPVGDGFGKRLHGSRASRWLARAALGDMLREAPTDQPFGTRMIHLTQFFLVPGVSYKLREFSRQARVAARIF